MTPPGLSVDFLSTTVFNQSSCFGARFISSRAATAAAAAAAGSSQSRIASDNQRPANGRPSATLVSGGASCVWNHTYGGHAFRRIKKKREAAWLDGQLTS